MRNSMVNVLLFAAGALIGSAVTYKFVEKKFKKIADEEIASVKEMYKKKVEKTDDDLPETIKNPTTPRTMMIKEAFDICKDNGYLNKNEKKEKEAEDMTNPYVISPEDFDENGYDTLTLIYYADEVLADEADNIIEEDEIENLICIEALSSFGDYGEDDSVYVRNDDRELDIEILLDSRKFSEINR